MIGTMYGCIRYYDVQSILGDSTHFSSAPYNPTLQRKRRTITTPDSLIGSDPPYHRTLRAVVASAFSPMTISKLEPRIESITHDLLNQVIERGNMDLINDLGYPLLVSIIAELLGAPLEDRDTFHV
jgi:cytochrome P450